MDGYGGPEHPWNQLEHNYLPNIDETPDLHTHQPSGFGVPNHFIQSDGVFHGHNYLPVNQPYPNFNPNIPYYHGPFVNTHHLPYPENSDGAYYNSFSLNQDVNSVHQDDHVQAESSHEIEHEGPSRSDKGKGTQQEIEQKGNSENTNRLAAYKWQKLLEPSDVLKIYRIMGLKWVAIRGPIISKTMQRCANSLDQFLEQNPEYSKKILVDESRAIETVFEKTKPHTPSVRGSERKRLYWTVEDLLKWLQTPIFISKRNKKVRYWGGGLEAKKVRKIVLELCRLWGKGEEAVQTRLYSAHVKNSGLIESLLPYLQGNEEQKQYAADQLLPKTELRRKIMREKYEEEMEARMEHRHGTNHQQPSQMQAEQGDHQEANNA